MALRSALRRAIAEVKQHWSVIGWVTIYYLKLLRALRHVKPLVPAAFAVISTQQLELGPTWLRPVLLVGNP
jgi:hypothetical protein